MREPGLHQGIISFPSIDRGLLRTPSQRLQPTGQVMRMVAHPKRHQHHRTDAQERPPIRVKARFQCPFFENRQHALPLLNTQAGWTAGNGACVQADRVAVVLPELSSPRAHSHPTDAQSAGDVGVGEWSGLEQPAGFQASCFTLTTGQVFRSPDHGRLL
jgi:hypothetical protein